jgi:hypothetical protein
MEVLSMNSNKNFWLTASGAVAVAGAILLVSAHRIEAQYSSPVRVMNTSSGPGRIPYFSEQSTSLSSPGTQVQIVFPAVPPNHRLVVQRIMGSYGLSVNRATTTIALSTSSFSLRTNSFTPSAAFTNQFDIPVQAYFEAGEFPTTIAYAQGASVFSNSAVSQLTGYLIDCSAAACAAIAH